MHPVRYAAYADIKRKELALSERIYLCECGNRMDRDVNAAVNILKEGKRIYKKCA
ncbi:transposase [Blautia wexlerae]|nr:transposase [Blautia wexlerae]